MTTFLRPTVTATIDGSVPLPAGRAVGSISLDSGAVPYATATVEMPLLDDATLELLDPFNEVRVFLDAGDATGTPRHFDLGLRGRTVNHVAKTVTLALAGDESLLQGYAPLTIDTGARAHEASLRSVVDYVLDKIGAALEAGSEDADVTAFWGVSNQFANPGSVGTISPWSSGGNCTVFQSGPWSPATPLGVYACGFTSLAAGPLAVTAYTATGPSVTPGKSYVISGYGRRFGATARTMSARIRWLNQAGLPVGPDVTGAPVTLTDTSWELAYCIATAPAGAVRVDAFYYVEGSTAASQIGYVAAAMWHEGNEVVPAFSGDTADTADYEYDWASDPYASASIRTATVERPPELYVWKPGVPAWDFLMMLTSAAGLMLWCDELRQWWLASPESRTLAEQVNLSASNVRDGTDTLSADDPQGHVTGIVVHYEWTDDDGISREAFDAAGTAQLVETIELSRAYPGHGAAAAILARRQGTGRVQQVTAVTRWETTPGVSAQITLPGAPATLGRVTGVRFYLPEGFMDVDTSGLIDFAADDWLGVDPDTDWEDIDTALDWEDA